MARRCCQEVARGRSCSRPCRLRRVVIGCSTSASRRLDQVLARGARVGDRVCVYELAASRLGCEIISAGDTSLALRANLAWQPEVVVTPNSATSLGVTVRNLPIGLALRARLYPDDGAASSVQTLTFAGGQYQATFTLAQSALAGYVHIWVEEAAPRREVVTDYGLGGSGARLRVRGGAPVLSPDGQVTLYIPDKTEAPGQLYTLQVTTRIPTPPAWATLVGQAYRLTASSGTSLAGSSLSFSYLGRDVPPGEERWLTIYFWNGSAWQSLATARDTANNQAIAATQGPGLYALVSSVEIPLIAGDNVVAYPVHTSRTVAQATASIAGAGPQVSRYNLQTGGWQPLGPTDLLTFGQGYRITVSQAIIWQLKGDGVASAASVVSAATNAVLAAPAIYFGIVQGDASWTPAVGLPVVAWVNGQPCGQGGTLADGERIVYMIAVAAEAGLSGCGASGRVVSFEVGGRTVAAPATWDNTSVQERLLRH